MNTSRALAVLCCAVCLAACGRKPAASSTTPPPAVTAITLQPERVALTRELPGRATPFLVAEVRPQVTGIVKRRLFEEGAKVEAGQPLYQLDDATYRADFERAKATLARARATAELARVNANRSAELAETSAVSRQEYDTARATLAQAEADVGVAEAVARSAEVVLGYATIRAPISGRIGRSAVTAGALVTANQSAALATVQQLDPIYVDVAQSSRELLELRQDFASGLAQRPDSVPVTILLEDGSHYQHAGRLAFAEVSVDPGTGSFALRVIVPNPDEILLPGIYVRAIITTGVRQAALVVPQQAVIRGPKGSATAMVVGPDDKVQVRTVEISRTVGDRWLVDEGLAAGERVITEGLQKVQPGMTVRVTEPAAAAAAPGASGTKRPRRAGSLSSRRRAGSLEPRRASFLEPRRPRRAGSLEPRRPRRAGLVQTHPDGATGTSRLQPFGATGTSRLHSRGATMNISKHHGFIRVQSYPFVVQLHCSG